MNQGPKTNTFVVQIACQQNATWQGTIKWIEQGKEMHFRSALELINMMDEATKAQLKSPAESDD